MSAVHLLQVGKTYEGSVEAVKDVTLTVNEGEFVAFLGPSGCGKTTTLRCIAGLEQPTRGEIAFGDTVVVSSEKKVFVPPEGRDIGMVFQSYAVWPHMTVFENVAFPLRIKKAPKAEIEERVLKALRLTKIEALADRYPTQLSGGQQQRVAVSRAIVGNPRVLLFDEPLSNLDAKLRDEMRYEISRLQQELGITTIYVTHDQSEAMVMADRVVVMKDGRVAQIGTPEEIYARPADTFVASFVGDANLIPVRPAGPAQGGRVPVEARTGGLRLLASAWGPLPQGEMVCLIRPENIQLAPGQEGAEHVYPATVVRRTYLGSQVEYELDVSGVKLVMRTHPDGRTQPGDKLPVRLEPEHCVLLSESGGGA